MLDELAGALDLRWRLGYAIRSVVDALSVSLVISIAAVLLAGVITLPLSLARIILLANGAAVAAGLFAAATRPASPSFRLLDADRRYGLHQLLSAGHEFAHAPRRELADEQALREVVIRRAEEAAVTIDAPTVYPIRPPARIAVAGALLLLLAIAVVLRAGGWLTPPPANLVEEGVLLEESARRLAERAPDNEELQALADEMRRLGEQLRTNRIDARSARERISDLAERVDEQVRNLERTAPLEAEEAPPEAPPETEEAVRRALSSGMSEGEVMEFFSRMRSEGGTMENAISSLEDATGEATAESDYEVDEERLRELLDQLNPRQSEPQESDLREELAEAGRTLQGIGGNMSELTQGEESTAGGEGAGGGSGGPSEEAAGDMPSGPGEGEGSGSGAGETPVPDTFGETPTTSPAGGILRQLPGVVTTDSVMDFIIRELPSDAISTLSEEEQEIAIQRAVEEAVRREGTPVEMQQLVRNYFLKITRSAAEGAEE